MPAEAVHLSALEDTLALAPAALRAALGGSLQNPLTRVGVMLVDLPYFEGLLLRMLRHLLARPQRPCPFGERLHQQAPIAVGRGLAEGARALLERRSTREEGRGLQALALGYISHAAVDAALHPLVNQLAWERARGDARRWLREHQEVEKLQSVLFHEQRLGRDYLGQPELSALVAIDWRPLHRPGPISIAVQQALRAALGTAPEVAALQRWAAGYQRYAALLGSPLARHAVSLAQRERERERVLLAVDFPARFAQAVQGSLRWTAALHDYLEQGRFDEAGRAALERLIPEQSLDPGAPASLPPPRASTPQTTPRGARP